MSKRKADYLQITARCPERGELVRTHAWMTARQVRRFDSQLAFFCSACRQPHLLGGPELRTLAAQERPSFILASPRDQPLGRGADRR